MTAPTPLPAGSSKLRARRFEVGVHGPKNDRGAYPALAEAARFTRLEHAKEWADENYPGAFLVIVDYLSATSGWRRSRTATRLEGNWDR